MRAMILAGALLALAPSQVWSQTAGAKAAYDLKGIMLGITLSEMRSMKARDDNVQGAGVVCTPDPEVGAISYSNVHVTEDERTAGIIRCAYYAPEINHTAAGLRMGAGRYFAYRYYFAFRAEALGAEPRLYEIWMMTSADARQGVLLSLRDKFGPPTSTKSDGAVTRLGGLVPRMTVTWNNGVSHLRVVSPAPRVDEMELTYRLIGPASKADAAVAQARRAGADRM